MFSAFVGSGSDEEEEEKKPIENGTADNPDGEGPTEGEQLMQKIDDQVHEVWIKYLSL